MDNEIELTPERIGRLVSQPEPKGIHIPIAIRPPHHGSDPVLSTRHPASSYGLPVLVLDGVAYGPGDLPGVKLYLQHGAPWTEAAKRAGWAIEEFPSMAEREQAEREERYQDQVVDQEAVDRFLADMPADATPEQIRKVIARIDYQVQHERPAYGELPVNEATQLAVRTRLVLRLQDMHAACWYCGFGQFELSPRCKHA